MVLNYSLVGCPWYVRAHWVDCSLKHCILKPRGNGSNIVGQHSQHCWVLRPFEHPVACCCVLLRKVWNRSNFKPHTRANGRSIVGQQPPTLIDVTCCVRPCLRYCAKFEIGQTFTYMCKQKQQLPTTLRPFVRRLKQHVCRWITSLGENVYVPLIHLFLVGLISLPF